VYENLKLDEHTKHPDIDGLVQDIKLGKLDAVANDMGNVLETVTIPEFPVIGDIKDRMMRSGAINAMMSGSGPTVFGLFSDEETAERAYRDMKESRLAKQVCLTTIYNNRRR
jgi:4-diphosphocytidyl-2-C-methyl-D-erythritol kinase